MVKGEIALIIDADIAQASSNAPKPTPENCRAFLNAVLQDDTYLLVMSPDLSNEWNIHQSAFARRWRLAMYARRRIKYVEPDFNKAMCKRAEEAGESINQRNAIFKDFHLVEAALASDQRVASMDELMRRLLGKAVSEKGVRELSVILWINPDKADDEALHWLHAGAPHEEPRCLGYLPDA